MPRVVLSAHRSAPVWHPLAAALATALLGLPVLEAMRQPPAALGQGKSHLAPGRQRGNPHPGGRKGGDDRWQRQPEWADWDRERWRLYNHSAPVPLWSEPVLLSPYALRPSWTQPNWIEARPWPTGWYGGWRQPPWLWWPGQASAWGVGSLAASSLINRAISQALGWGQPSILVPATSWRLLYGSVEPQGDAGVRFVVSNGSGTYRMGADCDYGLLNGRVPTTVGQAQLLHAACQVAYGGPGS